MFLDSVAYAMAGGGGGAAGGSGLTALIPLVLMFVIFYFLLIRPQQKRAKEHRDVLQNLKKGDFIVTNGGLYGRVVGLTDQVVTLEVAENVRVKVARSYVAGQAKEELVKAG
jgi:preprotein translocase subunit YajC